jgi:hypothetical protein
MTVAGAETQPASISGSAARSRRHRLFLASTSRKSWMFSRQDAGRGDSSCYPLASSCRHRDGSRESPHATVGRSWSTKWSTNWCRPTPVISKTTHAMPESRRQTRRSPGRMATTDQEVAGSSPAERALSWQVTALSRLQRLRAVDLRPRNRAAATPMRTFAAEKAGDLWSRDRSRTCAVRCQS